MEGRRSGTGSDHIWKWRRSNDCRICGRDKTNSKCTETSNKRTYLAVIAVFKTAPSFLTQSSEKMVLHLKTPTAQNSLTNQALWPNVLPWNHKKICCTSLFKQLQNPSTPAESNSLKTPETSTSSAWHTTVFSRSSPFHIADAVSVDLHRLHRYDSSER